MGDGIERNSATRTEGTVADYTADDARRDLDLLREQTGLDSVNRLAAHIERLEARAEAAERVCEAAAEMVAHA